MNTAIQTPCFVIDVKKIDEQILSAQKSLRKYWPDGILGYSFKTNNLPWVISYMKQKGAWAEVVSSDEYCLAEELGFQKQEIIFNGPAKGQAEFISAVENGAVVNLDSKRELDWLLLCDKEKLKKSRLGLRVNFCLEQYCPGESQCGLEDGRFGFSYENGELLDSIRFLRQHEIPLSGLHMHCSSKTRSLNIYRAIAEIAVEIVNTYALTVQYIDIGGGFFGGLPNKPSFEDYFSLVHGIFANEERLRSVNVIIEPGMAVIGACMEYVTSVVDVKRTMNNRFVLLDGSRIHVDPLMKKTSYAYRIHRKEQPVAEDATVDQILCGFTCMEADRFFKIDMPLLAPGDEVVFEKVGAYTIGLSPQFIEFYPPIYAKESGKLVLVRPKFTPKNFLI